MTNPVVAESNSVKIDLMKDFFNEQFKINESDESKAYWQVFDRTANEEVKDWTYENGVVTVNGVTPWHKYTVNFLAYRIWEEISMYNHTTNNWDKEHLMQIDPRYPETQQYMLDWMKTGAKHTLQQQLFVSHQCSITSYGFGVQTRETEIYSQIGRHMTLRFLRLL